MVAESSRKSLRVLHKTGQHSVHWQARVKCMCRLTERNATLVRVAAFNVDRWCNISDCTVWPWLHLTSFFLHDRANKQPDKNKFHRHCKMRLPSDGQRAQPHTGELRENLKEGFTRPQGQNTTALLTRRREWLSSTGRCHRACAATLPLPFFDAQLARQPTW